MGMIAGMGVFLVFILKTFMTGLILAMGIGVGQDLLRQIRTRFILSDPVYTSNSTGLFNRLSAA